MYHIGIDISKFKHNCFIATEAGVKVKEFIFDNNKSGFIELMDSLQSLGNPMDIKNRFRINGSLWNKLEILPVQPRLYLCGTQRLLNAHVFQGIIVKKDKD